MGTPDFAVAPLQNLVDEKFNVVGVITVADKPAGRGRKLRQSPVKVFADNKGLRVLQPTNLKDEDFLDELRALNADLQIVVAFRMLPEVVWKMPPMGTFNLHASLLPFYRGAAPINWAIINGESYSGITTFFLKHEIDTGNILLQKRVAISEDDDAGSLHDKLMLEGSQLVVDTLNKLLADDIKPIDQNTLIDGENKNKKAPKLFKEDCKIDFSNTSKKVYDFIRGLSPYPGAFTRILLKNGEEKMVKLFKVEKASFEGKPGSFKVHDSHLYVYTKDASLKVLELQLEGKKRMKAEDFLRGVQIG